MTQTHRAKELVSFLDQVSKEVSKEFAYRVIFGKYGTRKSEVVRKWLLEDPRFYIRCTPTYSS